MPTREEFDNHTENRNADGTVRIDSNIACTDKKSKSTYRYLNVSQKHVAKIRVDGGLIATDAERCDWLLVNWDDGVSFFIELKGSDLFKAISQVTSTINHIWNDLNALAIQCANARIVLSKNRFPAYKNDSRYKIFEKLVKQKNGDTPKIGAQQMQEQY